MNRTELEEHVRESGEQNLVIRINGWLGSGGEGMVVMDDLRVRQLNQTELDLENLNDTTISLTNNSKCIEVKIFVSNLKSVHKKMQCFRITTPATAPPAFLVITTASPLTPASGSCGPGAGVTRTGMGWMWICYNGRTDGSKDWPYLTARRPEFLM